MRLFVTLFCVTSIVVISGCGTILTGTLEEVSITSIPPGQEIRIDGKPHKTPVVVMLEKKDNHTVVFPGDQIVKIEKTFWGNWEHYLNILWMGAGLVPGFVGAIIDYISGGQENLEPDQLEYKDGKVYNVETGEVLGQGISSD